MTIIPTQSSDTPHVHTRWCHTTGPERAECAQIGRCIGRERITPAGFVGISGTLTETTILLDAGETITPAAALDLAVALLLAVRDASEDHASEALATTAAIVSALSATLDTTPAGAR